MVSLDVLLKVFWCFRLLLKKYSWCPPGCQFIYCTVPGDMWTCAAWISSLISSCMFPALAARSTQIISIHPSQPIPVIRHQHHSFRNNERHDVDIIAHSPCQMRLSNYQSRRWHSDSLLTSMQNLMVPISSQLAQKHFRNSFYTCHLQQNQHKNAATTPAATSYLVFITYKW